MCGCTCVYVCMYMCMYVCMTLIAVGTLGLEMYIHVCMCMYVRLGSESMQLTEGAHLPLRCNNMTSATATAETRQEKTTTTYSKHTKTATTSKHTKTATTSKHTHMYVPSTASRRASNVVVQRDNNFLCLHHLFRAGYPRSSRESISGTFLLPGFGRSECCL